MNTMPVSQLEKCACVAPSGAHACVVPLPVLRRWRKTAITSTRCLTFVAVGYRKKQSHRASITSRKVGIPKLRHVARHNEDAPVTHHQQCPVVEVFINCVL